MFNFQSFEDVFESDPECSFDEDAVKEIESNRKTYEGLFVEKVMKLMGIKRPSKYYPPKSNADLRNLHKVLIETTAADHHKISVLYYLLLHLDYPTGERRLSVAFERKSSLPNKYSTYMKGLWHLDRGEFAVCPPNPRPLFKANTFQDAVQYLTHPSLIPTFPDEILEVLVRYSTKDLTLALAYYYTIQPSLTSNRAIECLISAIARNSVTEAFYFSRSQPQHTQRHMFEMITSLVLHNSPAQTIADRSVELINLPFSEVEEAWFEEYLLQGEGVGIKKARDTVLMRRIGTGKFKESMAFGKGLTGRAINGLDWNGLSNAVKDGLGPRAKV
ncbi:hypothetical protein G7Y89_g2023 [Cudoniella acicularis]|uniref:ELYS-like domain-containing protein n=1 Tax=Cudoniella acicularis TaxID=354080 RepID=A0A8H4RU70_9HELO|nr:hypothetical protein G7Y89_g2023 [Cudoniella acicularis]